MSRGLCIFLIKAVYLDGLGFVSLITSINHFFLKFIMPLPVWPDRQSFFKWVYWDWYQPQHWPRAISRLVYNRPHLNNEQRFKVAVFFLGNGMSPKQVRDFFMIPATKDGTRFHYDAQAWRQIEYIIRNFPGRWTWWDITLGKSSNKFISR